MKTLTYVFVFFALLVVINACKKASTGTIELVASSASVKTGQPDSLELRGVSATDSVKWSVSPTAGLNGIYYKGNHAIVNFNQPGAYTVTAKLNNATSYSTSINVDQAPVTPADTIRATAVHYPLTGDGIVLTPQYQKSTKSDSVYIYFIAQTNKFYYCLNSYLNYNTSLLNGYTLNIVDMVKPSTASCQVGSARITSGNIPFRQSLVNNYLATGTYPINVTLNGNTYMGSVTVDNVYINFSWQYTSGVTMSPLRITR